MRGLSFPIVFAAVVLSAGCSPANPGLIDTAGPAGPAAGPDAGPRTRDAAACSDVRNDPHNCGSCGHDCLGGECFAGTCQPAVIVSGLAQPEDMAIDESSVYWPEPFIGQIRRVAKVGGPPVAVVTSSLLFGARIAVDSGYLYWTQGIGGTVNRVPVGGGTPEVVAQGLAGPSLIVAGAGDVYVWTENDRTVRLLAQPPVVVLPDQFVVNMALDSTSLYCATLNGIFKIPRHGGAAQTLAPPPPVNPDSGVPIHEPYGLAADALNLYATYLADPPSSGGMVVSTPLDGGASSALCAQCAGSYAITADPSGIYWTELHSGNIVTLRGGNPTVIASGQGLPQAIATDDAGIYWIDYGTIMSVNGALPAVGAVMRLAK